MRLPAGNFFPDVGGGGCSVGVIIFIGAILLIGNKVEDCSGKKQPPNIVQRYVQPQPQPQPQPQENPGNTRENKKPVNSVSEGLTHQTSYLYMLKVNKFDVNNYAQDYLERFDNNFSTYANNEIELQTQKESAVQEIKARLEQISYKKVYTVKFNSEFGEYNLINGEFEFTPFKNNTRIAMSETSYFKTNQGVDLFVGNPTDFEGFPMEKDAANNFLKARTNNGYVKRDVYLKLYITVLPIKWQDGYKQYETMMSYNPGAFLWCFVKKVEVWSDENRTNALLGTLTSKTDPATLVK